MLRRHWGKAYSRGGRRAVSAPVALERAGGLLLENVLDLVDFKADLAPQHRWFKRSSPMTTTGC
jgi:hypothetical protein